MILKLFKKKILELAQNPKIIIKKIFVLFKVILKFIILIIEMPIYIICIPVIFFILISNNFYKIRFGIIRSQPFGNSMLDMSLIKLFKNLEKSKSLDLFCYKKKFINTQLFKFAKREFNISYLYKYFYNLSNIFRLKSIQFPTTPELRDHYSIFKDKQRRYGNHFPYFKFKNDEDENAYEFLKKVGLNKDSKFICIILRDSKYKTKLSDGIDYDYHSFRNVDVNNYKQTIIKLIEKGYWVFRMGSIVENKLDINSEKFIDYPFINGRNDMLDIWLMAHCHFCITSGTGLDMASICFGKPIVYTNLAEYKPPFFFFNSDLAIFKRIKSTKTNKILSFSEIKKNNLTNIMSKKTLDAKKLVLEENSSEEITETVIEMHEKMNNSNKYENYNSQKKFWQNLLAENISDDNQNNFKTRIGKFYFEKNLHWLNN
jgi:putative glycosyltransferase (TIGR04372 family)